MLDYMQLSGVQVCMHCPLSALTTNTCIDHSLLALKSLRGVHYHYYNYYIKNKCFFIIFCITM